MNQASISSILKWKAFVLIVLLVGFASKTNAQSDLLFDQMLKGTYDECHMILDAGCGTGRNLLYLLKSGANVFGVDQNPEAIAQIRVLKYNSYAQNNNIRFNFYGCPAHCIQSENTTSKDVEINK